MNRAFSNTSFHSELQGNPALSLPVRLASTITTPASSCVVQLNCLIASGSLDDMCVNGGTLDVPDTTGSCAQCPAATDVSEICGSTNTLVLNTFSVAGDDTVCLEFDQDPAALAGQACTLSIASTVGAIDGGFKAFTNCTVATNGAGSLVAMDVNDGIGNAVFLTQLNDALCGHTLIVQLGVGVRKRQAPTILSVLSSIAVAESGGLSQLQALEAALIAGGCTTCTVSVACPTMLPQSFSAGELECDSGGLITSLVIDPTVADGSASDLGSLTSLFTSDFLIGVIDGAVKFRNNPLLSSVHLSAMTSVL